MTGPSEFDIPPAPPYRLSNLPTHLCSRAQRRLARHRAALEPHVCIGSDFRCHTDRSAGKGLGEDGRNDLGGVGDKDRRYGDEVCGVREDAGDSYETAWEKVCGEGGGGDG